MTVGDSDVIRVNPTVYTRNNTPVQVSESPLVIPDIDRQGRVVGYVRLSGGSDQHAATLCEVVVVGREFIGKPSIQAFKTVKLNYYLSTISIHPDTCCIYCS